MAWVSSDGTRSRRALPSHTCLLNSRLGESILSIVQSVAACHISLYHFLHALKGSVCVLTYSFLSLSWLHHSLQANVGAEWGREVFWKKVPSCLLHVALEMHLFWISQCRCNAAIGVHELGRSPLQLPAMPCCCCRRRVQDLHRG